MSHEGKRQMADATKKVAGMKGAGRNRKKPAGQPTSPDVSPEPAKRKSAVTVPGMIRRGRGGASQVVGRVSDEHDRPVAFNLSFLGSGQCGGRIAQSFWELGYRRVAAFNSTDQDFADLDDGINKLFIGKNGTGKNADKARKLLDGKGEDEVWDLLVKSWGEGTDYALICASLGGGTGSGTAEGLARIARRYLAERGGKGGPKVGAVVAMPKASEGGVLAGNAVKAFEALVEAGVSPLVVIDNGRVDELYDPAVSELYDTVNSIVAEHVHLFNEQAARRDGTYTFDREELSLLFDSGIVSTGSVWLDAEEIESPADITTRIRDRMHETVLADVDVSTGGVGACVFTLSPDVAGRMSNKFFDPGFDQLRRGIGGGRPGVTVHRGMYTFSGEELDAIEAAQGSRENWIRCAVMVGGMAPPADALNALRDAAGMRRGNYAASLARHLGVDDGDVD